MCRWPVSAPSRAACRRRRYDCPTAGAEVTTMLQVEDLSKSFGGVAAMQNVTLDFPAGSLTAIIGPNGAGKTTFFNLISGAMRPGPRPREARRRGYRRPLADPDRAARHRARVPDRQHFSVADGGGNPHGRGAGAHGQRGAHHAALPAARMPRPRRRGHDDARARGQGGRHRRRASRTAIRSCSTSGSRWRSSRACFCSTSRRQAWGRKNAGR